MRVPTVRDIAVLADQIRLGDVISIGGLPHQVTDIRQVRGERKRLHFDDGNTYVLPTSMPITVSRTFDNSRRRPWYSPPRRRPSR